MARLEAVIEDRSIALLGDTELEGVEIGATPARPERQRSVNYNLSCNFADARPPLFFQRRFLPMWSALALGAFTDNMLKQALSIALAYGIITAPLISNDDALPIIGSLFPAAMLLFSTIAGQLADKYETSFMFRRTKLAEFLLMILAGIGFLLGSSVILILALFLMGAQSAFFSPVRTSSMPKYLHANELVRGNAFAAAVYSFR